MSSNYNTIRKSTTITSNSNPTEKTESEPIEEDDDFNGGWRPSVRVILIRHAESANNQVYRNARYIYGGGTSQFDTDGWNRYVNTHRQADPGLSDTVGYPQAEQLAHYLLQQPRFETSNHSSSLKFIVSPMRRTCETIRPTLHKLSSPYEVIIHGEYFESEGCHVCGIPQPGMSPEQIRQVFLQEPPTKDNRKKEVDRNNNSESNHNPVIPFHFESFPPATETLQGWWNGTGPETREQSETRAARFYLWLGEYLDQQLATTIAESSAEHSSSSSSSPNTTTIVLVGHGDFMSLVLKRIIAGPGYFVEHTGIPHRSALVHANTGMTELEYFGKSRYLVLSTNQTPHLSNTHHAHLISGGTLQDGWSYLIPNDTILQNTQILIAEYHELEHHIREQTQALQSLYWKRSSSSSSSSSNLLLLDETSSTSIMTTTTTTSTTTTAAAPATADGLSVETDLNSSDDHPENEKEETSNAEDDDPEQAKKKQQPRHPHLIVRRGNEVVGVAVFDGRILSDVAIRPSAGLAATRALVEAAKRQVVATHNNNTNDHHPPMQRSQSLLVLPRTRQDVQFFEALGFVPTEQSSSTNPHLELKH